MICENQRKKPVRTNSIIVKKAVEINKVLIMPLKPLGLLGAMTTELHCVFLAVFPHIY